MLITRAIAVAILTVGAAAALQAQPDGLLCESRAENDSVGDTHREFF
ncbi:MAG: hypothetical protein ACOCZ7_04905 [Armatimonadota bacterium]